MSSSKEIHIIGAGSTGLSAAFFLARKGFRPVVYDKRLERRKISKALGVNPNTLSLFDGTGVTERFLQNGWKCSCMNIWSRDKLVFKNDFSGVRHKYPFMLIQPQHETESILEEMLGNAGVEIQKGHALESVAPTQNSTRLTFRYGENTVEVDAGGLVIGADGSKSVVREKCGIDFRGWEHREDFELVDMELETPLTHREGHYRFFSEGGLLMLHIRDGVWRIASNMKNMLDYLPSGTRMGKVAWQATFRVGEKVASRFSRNQVYLLGDAAHIHSPAGARGMNTCIEDSHIFAELVAAHKEESYHDVRHGDIKRMVGVLGQLTDKVSGRNFIGRTIRNNFHRMSFLFPLFMPRMRKFLLGIK